MAALVSELKCYSQGLLDQPSYILEKQGPDCIPFYNYYCPVTVRI